MLFHDLSYFIYLAPALLLGLWAQARVRSAFAEAQQVGTPMSGAEAARMVLDSAGLRDVQIEAINGYMTDHYDPREKVLRLSPEVYQGHTMAAVGVAAHEAGHALQDAHRYAPLALRNAAVPVANFGGGISMILIIAGFVMQLSPLVWFGIAAFSGLVFFQLINLPVEFDASRRAKDQLAELGIVPRQEQGFVGNVLNAAAWTYVAGTLQSVLTLLYYVVHFGGAGGDRDS